MTPKLTQISTGEYSYNKRVEYSTEQCIGHSVYGLDKQGQVWKYTCRNKVWNWAKLEDCNEEIYD